MNYWTAKFSTILIVTAFSIATGRASEAPLPGSPDTAGEAFNAVARDYNTNQRMVLTECENGMARSCTYTLTGKLGVVALSPVDKPEELKSIMLVVGKGSNPADLLISMGLLMIVYSPESDQSERATAISALSTGVSDGKEKSTVTLTGTTYSITNVGNLGI